MNLWKKIALETSPTLKQLWEKRYRFLKGQSAWVETNITIISILGYISILCAACIIPAAAYSDSTGTFICFLGGLIGGSIFFPATALGLYIRSDTREFLSDVKTLKLLIPEASYCSRNDLFEKSDKCLKTCAEAVVKAQKDQNLFGTSVPEQMRKILKGHYDILLKFDLAEESLDKYFPKE